MAKSPKAARTTRPKTDDAVGCLTLVWVAIGLLFTAAIGAVIADHFNLFKHSVPAGAPKPIASASIARPAAAPSSVGAAGGAAGAVGIGQPSPPESQQALVAPRLPQTRPGTPAWMAYAVPSVPHLGPIITVVIDDMGLDRKRSARAMELPGPLTMSFMAYAEELNAQTAIARQHGHELLMHVPMEPMGALDPGPDALDVALPLAEIDRRLQRNLARFQGFVGINNHMGSKFTAYRPGMELVMETLRARGLLWLDSRTTAETEGPALAVTYQVPNAQRDVFLDDVATASGVRKQLKELENIAQRRGRAIAIGHPKDATLQALAAWLPGLRREGLTLVPLSEMVQAQSANR
jgi:polysaccharide deacetylase 2 family uncharacterized protein YibQ